MKQYDAVIIGFGKAGKTLAGTLGDAGWNVALIEQSAAMYGGTCINIACIPTKSLLHDAVTQIPYTQAVSRKDDVTGTLRQRNFSALDDRDTVDIYTGQAQFLNDHDIQISTADETLTIRGEKIFINTGTEPSLPPIKGLAGSSRVYTSTTLMEVDKLPGQLAIIGGGNIGLEFATTYAKFGSRVTVLEAGSRLLPHEDEDMATAIQRELEALGISFVFNVKAHEVSDISDGVRLAYQTADGDTVQIEVDGVLAATGRTPVTRDLGLDLAGVATDNRGYIIVNDALQTTVSHIWALGDVNGGPQFTYISLDDFRIIKSALLGDGTRRTTDRKAVPRTLFLDPTFARVGMTEVQAHDEGIDIAVATLSVAAIPRALVGDDTRGVLKAIVNKQSGKILGVALLCTNAEELINLVSLAMSLDQDYTVLRDRIYTHPTMSEALNDLFGRI